LRIFERPSQWPLGWPLKIRYSHFFNIALWVGLCDSVFKKYNTFLYDRYDEVSEAYMELSSLSLGRNYKQKEVSFWLSLLPRNEDTDLEQVLTGFMLLAIWIQHI
jgi:hypothetical protein